MSPSHSLIAHQVPSSPGTSLVSGLLRTGHVFPAEVELIHLVVTREGTVAATRQRRFLAGYGRAGCRPGALVIQGGIESRGRLATRRAGCGRGRPASRR